MRPSQSSIEHDRMMWQAVEIAAAAALVTLWFTLALSIDAMLGEVASPERRTVVVLPATEASTPATAFP
jgi:hypothetical protein